jgi:hypothetical protein
MATSEKSKSPIQKFRETARAVRANQSQAGFNAALKR